MKISSCFLILFSSIIFYHILKLLRNFLAGSKGNWSQLLSIFLLTSTQICVHSGFNSVGNKLCFFLCACICQSFFMQLLVYPLTVFCLGMSEMQVSHICIQRAENSICYVVYRPFSGVGGGSAIYYWLLFQYLSLDVISFFFFFF